MQKGTLRRFLVMCFGILIMGLGVCLFKISLMGNDPSTALAIAVADRIGLDFSILVIVINSIYFIAEIFLGRKYIGAGTFVNWFFVGPLASFYEKLLRGVWNVPEGFVPRLVIMVAGVLILSLSASLYQTADLGIAPYDSLSIIMRDRLPLPYFWCRIITDATCAAVCWLLGGIVGLGTLVCALGLGPFIHFFNKHISEKLCSYPEKGEKTPV